jgi:hypothetical protein
MTTASPRPPAINFEYRGFRNLEDRREYLLSVRTGPDSRDYTLWIAHESFAARQAQLQDGPDICYRKLQLQLAEGHGNDADYIAVTPADLASYKEAHTIPARRKPIKPKLP